MIEKIYNSLIQYKWSGDIKLREQTIYCNDYRIVQEDKYRVQLHFNTVCNPLLAIRVQQLVARHVQSRHILLGASFYIDEVNQVNFTKSNFDKDLING